MIFQYWGLFLIPNRAGFPAFFPRFPDKSKRTKYATPRCESLRVSKSEMRNKTGMLKAHVPPADAKACSSYKSSCTGKNSQSQDSKFAGGIGSRT